MITDKYLIKNGVPDMANIPEMYSFQVVSQSAIYLNAVISLFSFFIDSSSYIKTD